MKKVLFICQANIGRSQIAEAFYNHYSKGKFAISAGVDDVGEKYNFTPTPHVFEVMSEKGIDITGQKIKPLNQEIIDEIDEIVVLCSSEIVPEYIKNSSKKVIYNEILDPYQRSYEELRQIRDEIEALVLKMIASQDS